ncbi:LPS assembly lipoprotein LptE [Magnetospira thiophila]
MALAGCGFRPLYGDFRAGDSPAELSQIHVDRIEDRIGQQLQNYLFDRINPKGRPSRPLYSLRIKLEDSTNYLGYNEKQDVTRANLHLQAHYTLYRKATHQIIKSGSLTVTSSYNVISSDFATEIADRKARSEAARLMADEITTQLAVFFIQQRDNRASSRTPQS